MIFNYFIALSIWKISVYKTYMALENNVNYLISKFIFIFCDIENVIFANLTELYFFYIFYRLYVKSRYFFVIFYLPMYSECYYAKMKN